MNNRAKTPTRSVVGLIPAAGSASRLMPIPCSKEVFPLGLRTAEDGTPRPKAMCLYLLERMRLAGIRQAYVAIRPGKWDIPAYLGDGHLVDMDLAYLMVRLPYGVPYTLDQAYPFLRECVTAVGYPDILFTPADAFRRLIDRQQATGADLVLGAVPWTQPEKGGMLEFDSAGKVSSIVEKPLASTARYSFCTLVWAPTFAEFLHDHLQEIERSRTSNVSRSIESSEEVILAGVIQRAINRGLRVEAEVFPDGSYLDIGTPNDLAEASRRMAVDRHSGVTADWSQSVIVQPQLFPDVPIA